jgi:transcriptional regulator with XRE-family HTH domain
MQGIENEGSMPSLEVLFLVIRELGIPPSRIFLPEIEVANPAVEYLTGLLHKCDESDIRSITAVTKSLINERRDYFYYNKIIMV